MAVLPVDDAHILEPGEIDDHEDLSEWWSQVEKAWETHRRSDETLPLLRRFDFHGQLSAQFPLDSTSRVAYTKAGSTLCAAIIPESTSVIDHKLYWARLANVDEAHYLTGVLNAPALLTRVQRYQTLGLFGARDFDKYVFRADFPRFDPQDHHHQEVVALSERAEKVAAEVDVSATRTFQHARAAIVSALTDNGVLSELDDAVVALLGPASTESSSGTS